MPPTLAEQVITLMVATNDLTSSLPPGKTKTDVIILVCIFIGMVTFFAFMTRGLIKMPTAVDATATATAAAAAVAAAEVEAAVVVATDSRHTWVTA